MHFCTIAPTTTLDRYARRSTYQLCLAQYCYGADAASRAYFEWYSRRARARDTVILDNGAYEAAGWQPERYLQLIEELRPTVVTLPDKVGDYDETCRLIQDFAGAVRSFSARPTLGKCEHMIVVQQHPEASLLEWAHVYATFDIGFCDWIAFPRILGTRRVELIAGLRRSGTWHGNMKHHAFGMNAGSLDELPKLNTLGIDSCDSSAPVWRGLMGYHINSTMEWPDVPFDPHYNIDVDSSRDITERMQLKQLADHNLEEVLTACQQRSVMLSPIKAETI